MITQALCPSTSGIRLLEIVVAAWRRKRTYWTLEKAVTVADRTLFESGADTNTDQMSLGETVFWTIPCVCFVGYTFDQMTNM